MDQLIDAQDLIKDYGERVKTRALKGVSFSVARGEFLGIIGQSGSGKSTLLNLLGLLDRPTEGRLDLLGTDVSRLSDKARAEFRNRHIGFVFQFHHLLPEFSVRENLLMPAWIGGPRAQERQEDDETLDLLGLNELLDKNANDLSGGQKQRVAIARALANRPDLILADEPTGNLDSENSASVYRLFRMLHERRRTTFIIVTHDRSIAAQTDRIIEVRDGLIDQDVRNEYSGEQTAPQA